MESLDHLLVAIYAVTVPLMFFLVRRFRWDRAVQTANFRQVFEEAPMGIAIFPLSGPRAGMFDHSNLEMARMTGYRERDLIDQGVVDIAAPDQREEVRANLGRAADGRKHAPMVERRWVHADGSTIWVRLTSTILEQPLAPDNCMLMAVDITAQKRAEAKLTRQALYDPLTGLANRMLLQDHLNLALKRSRRLGNRVAVLYVDMDDFGTINNEHGHDFGDVVLVEAAQRLRECLRQSDTAARMGGDEFIVLYEEVVSDADVDKLVQRIAVAMARPVVVGERIITISASIGVALGYGDVLPDDLVQQAGAAMQLAKKSGKARHALASEDMVARLHANAKLDVDLRTALAQDQFVLYYQPVVDVNSRLIVGVEALLRWQHPEEGILLPGTFMDLAEERDLILPLGAWVLSQACQQAAAWSKRFGAAAPYVSVNVASRQLSQSTFVESVRVALTDAEVGADKLVLEVTERQILNIDHSTQADLADLTRVGARLSLDDFGTGYSTFDYVRRFPFNVLKIDRSFVQDLNEDVSNQAIVRALLTLSYSLGLSVVAEGVETEGQLDTLRLLGCRYVQGFLLYRPMEAEKIDALIEAQTQVEGTIDAGPAA